MSVTLSALDLELGKVASSVDGVVGESARGHAHYAAQEARLAQTAIWAEGQSKLGQTLSVKALAAPGGLFLVAGARGQVNTPWGVLGLDPASLVVLGFSQANVFGTTLGSAITVPQQRALIGVGLSIQAVSFVNGTSKRLDFTVIE